MDINSKLSFVELTPSLYDSYIAIGSRAYNQHYEHLWPKGDTSTYITYSFTTKVLLKEELDTNTQLYLIQLDENYIGIIKITLHKSILTFSETQSIFLDKIYLLKEYSGMGVGSKCMQFVEEIAKNLSKNLLFLECMQSSKALSFYLAHDFVIVANSKVPFDNVLEEEKPMYLLKKELK